MLRTNRGMVKFTLLFLVTGGLYGIFVMSHISEEINQVASSRDGKHTMHFCLMLLIFSWLSVGIAPFVWYHRLSNRIGNELKARNLPVCVSAGTYWGWGVLGSLIVVGPFVYLHRLLKGMNQINRDYNYNLSKRA